MQECIMEHVQVGIILCTFLLPFCGGRTFFPSRHFILHKSLSTSSSHLSFGFPLTPSSRFCLFPLAGCIRSTGLSQLMCLLSIYPDIFAFLYHFISHHLITLRSIILSLNIFSSYLYSFFHSH